VTRCTRRLLAGAIALLVPALAGCEAGFNAPTLQFHPASFGVSTMVDGINIDNAFVLGPAPDSAPLSAGGQAGVFLSLEAQNSDQLTSVTASGAASSVQLASGPITLPADKLVDLSGPAPQLVLNGLTDSLSGGQTIQLVLHFATAGAVTLMVPVEPAAYEFATFSPPAAAVTTLSPSASASGSAQPGAKRKKKANAGASASASPSASVSPSATP
jgi:hypothetical protein